MARKTGGTVAVLLVWVAMLVAAHVFVARYASPFPFQDDLELATPLAAELPLTRDFLWAQENEHRVPLPKLVCVGLVWLTRDFRACMLLSVWVQGIVSLLLVLAAARLRGRPSPFDACFPFLWLNWGSATTYMLAIAVTISLPVALVATLLVIFATGRPQPTPRAVAGIAACVLLLPLCGGFGLCALPPIAVWLVYAGIVLWRAPEARARRSGAGLLAIALLAGCLVALYFRGLDMHGPNASRAGLGATLRTAAQVLSLGFGPAGERCWPVSALAVLLIGGIAVHALVRVLRARPDDRLRAAGILAVLASGVSLALFIGWGRGASGSTVGFSNRYVMLPAPFLCAAFLAGLRALPGAPARFVPAALCALSALALPYNARFGKTIGGIQRDESHAIAAALLAGKSPAELAQQLGTKLYPSPETAALQLRRLYRAGYPPFDGKGLDYTNLDLSMFDPRPVLVRSELILAPLHVGGFTALMVPPSGEVLIDVTRGMTQASGRFGLLPWAIQDAAEEPRPGEGAVHFSIEWRPALGPEVVLFERTLDPLVATDRGLQAFTLRLPLHEPGQIILRTSKPSGWGTTLERSFWAAVELR